MIILPFSNVTIHIKKLLESIKNTAISDIEAEEITLFTTNLTQDLINKLISGFFGIYVKIETDSQTRQNINKLLPNIWKRVDEEIKNNFGLKYAHFTANNTQEEKKLSRQFLQIVNAESYIPDDLRSIEIDNAINDLLSAHRSFNNFYTEPALARQLLRLVGNELRIPKNVEKKFITAIVEAFLTNGYGIAHNANDTYVQILTNFNSHQGNIAVLSFTDIDISSKFRFDLCKKKHKELINIVRSSITSPAVNELIDYIINEYKGEYSNLINDTTIKNHIENLKILLK